MRQATQYTWALYENRQATFDASGNATIIMFPGTGRERWVISLINISATSIVNSTLVPIMTMYRSAPVAAYRLGGSYNGLGDTNSSDTILLNMNEPIYFVWTGGDPGETCTVRVEGTRYVWE